MEGSTVMLCYVILYVMLYNIMSLPQHAPITYICPILVELEYNIPSEPLLAQGNAQFRNELKKVGYTKRLI